MENKLPIPTDNFYKFFALFGVLVLVFSCTLIIYTTRSTNGNVVALRVLRDSIQNSGNTSQSELPNIVEEQLSATKSDQGIYLLILSAVMSLGLFITAYGFIKWRFKVQPVNDEMADIQLQMAKLQLKKLELELAEVERKEREIDSAA